MQRPRSPLRWFGAKTLLAREIASVLPEHEHYVEVFGGSGAVLFEKDASMLETFNDLDDRIWNLFVVLRDRDANAELVRLLEATPFARRAFDDARAVLAAAPVPLAQVPTSAMVRAAWALLVAVNQSHGRLPARTGWAPSVARGGSSNARKWLNTVGRVRCALERLAVVQLERAPWESVIERYDGPGTCFYLDPPYHPDARRGGAYGVEMTAGDHDRLVARVLSVEGTVVLSGYETTAYEPLAAGGWELRRFGAVAARGPERRREELLWLSTPPPQRTLW